MVELSSFANILALVNCLFPSQLFRHFFQNKQNFLKVCLTPNSTSVWGKWYTNMLLI